MAVVTVARPLGEKLGEEGTDALVALINKADKGNKREVIEIGEERFERRLSEEISKLRTDMADLCANLIQWMFLFWISQIGVFTGILVAVFRKWRSESPCC